jgi:hypothetical protein
VKDSSAATLWFFARLGKNIVIIRNGRTSKQAGGERAGRLIRLEIQDVYALKEQSRLLEFVTPELMRGAVQAKSPFNAASAGISGSGRFTSRSEPSKSSGAA